MGEPKNGFEYLKRRHEQEAEKSVRFDGFKRYLEVKARERGIPVTGQFELTPLCNFDCKMCYVHLQKDQLKTQTVLTAEQWKELIRQAWKMGMIRATLTGGECLAYPGFKEIYLYLHSLGCEVVVLTNGFLIDDEWVSFFREHPPAQIRITLYGYDDDTYEKVTGRRCFERIRTNILKLQDAGMPLTISVTPNRYLGEGIFETIRTAKKLSKSVLISNTLFTPRKETGRDEEEHRISDEDYVRMYTLLNSLDGKETIRIPKEELPPVGGPSHECSECGVECGAGRSSFNIDWKGTMHPCTRFYALEAFPVRDGFEKAWRSLNKEANSWPRVAECEGCAYASTCLRCPANMLAYEKPGVQPVKMCERMKYFVENGVWQIPECDD